MKIYLAGPMSGLKDHNYPAFHAAAARIRARGFQCINPAELHPHPPRPVRSEWVKALRVDLAKLAECDAIALLPGWEKSEGARLEVHIAGKLGLTILDEETWATLPAAARKALIREYLAFPAVTPPAPGTPGVLVDTTETLHHTFASLEEPL